MSTEQSSWPKPITDRKPELGAKILVWDEQNGFWYSATIQQYDIDTQWYKRQMTWIPSPPPPPKPPEPWEEAWTKWSAPNVYCPEPNQEKDAFKAGWEAALAWKASEFAKST